MVTQGRAHLIALIIIFIPNILIGAIQNEFIIRWNGDSKVLLNELSKTKIVKSQRFLSMKEFALVTVEKNTKEAIKILEGVDGVDYVEPNYTYQSYNQYDYVPRDKKFKKQWGIHNRGKKIDRKREKVTRGADMKVLKAWNAIGDSQNAARDIIVAVVDTGVNYRHEDLKSNIWKNRTR